MMAVRKAFIDSPKRMKPLLNDTSPAHPNSLLYAPHKPLTDCNVFITIYVLYFNLIPHAPTGKPRPEKGGNDVCVSEIQQPRLPPQNDPRQLDEHESQNDQ
jgi:hypothetical protein